MREHELNGAGPDGSLTYQRPANKHAQAAQRAERGAATPPAETDGFYADFWEKLIEKSTISPSGEDPAFWPINMLSDFNYLVLNRAYTTDARRATLADRLAPIHGSIRNVTVAYAIAAYPQFKNGDRRDLIRDMLEADSQLFNRDAVALNSTELEVVQALCVTPRYELRQDSETLQPSIPLDPKKRVFRYSEVLSPTSSQQPQALLK